MPKKYDQVYFDSWYRGKESPIGSRSVLGRKVSHAVALTELVLDRPLRSVLDVGCGEGRWQPEVSKLRPGATYLGIDSSDYVVKRYGAKRNIRLGTFAEIEYHVFEEPFDLVVCSDVLHYLTRPEILAGLPALANALGGVALLEVFTRSDEIEGDMAGFKRRYMGAYLEMFSAVGLVPVGMQAYVADEMAADLDALDSPG